MWRVVDARAAGTSHRGSQTGCQDRQAIRRVVSPDGVTTLVSVISDGAGSAARADEGAQAVVDFLLDAATTALTESSDLDAIADTTIHSWFARLRDLLRQRSAGDEQRIGDFSATALLAVAGHHQTLCAQLGDGAIVLRTGPDSPFDVAIWPQNGEYVNETTFVTDPGAVEAVELYRCDQIDDLILFSDGLERVAIDLQAKAAFGEFCVPLVRFVREASDNEQALAEQLQHFLESDRINARTDDDKSLIVACRLP